MRTRIFLYFLTCLLIFVSLMNGCTPLDEESYYVSGQKAQWAGISVIELVRNSSRKGQPEYFSTEQLIAMLKEPELTLKVSELPNLLKKDYPEKQDYPKEIMQRMYERYLWQLNLEKYESHIPWHDSKRFNNLDVWLYNYAKPGEEMVCGLIPRRTGVFVTEYFLIEDSNVVGKGTLSRRFK